MRKILFLLIAISFLYACQERPGKALPYQQFAGKTMGTFYEISYQDSLGINRQSEIDQLLTDFNQSLSTYIPESIISAVNQSKGKIEVDASFARVFKDAQAIYKESDAYFDPSIMPLVNFWGFGFEKIPNRDESKLAELKATMGFNELKLVKDQSNYKVYLDKPRKETQIDFSAIAKGTGVDLIAEYLERNDIDNYLVNIGGEVRAKGNSSSKRWWKLGVNVPKEDAAVSEYQEIISLQNKSMATSGNYRNHKVIDGQKVVHTINPKTGRPEISNLLSATVIAKECALADAYATVCMVLGVERAQKIIEADYRLEGLLLYGDASGEIKTWKSKGVETVRGLARP